MLFGGYRRSTCKINRPVREGMVSLERRNGKDMGEGKCKKIWERRRNKIKYLEGLREQVAFEERLKKMREPAGKTYLGEQHCNQREEQQKRFCVSLGPLRPSKAFPVNCMERHLWFEEGGTN